MAASDFPHLRCALAESRLALGAGWMIERLQAAWEDSRAAAVARAAAVRFQVLPDHERVRYVAFALGVAAAGYLLLLRVTPSYAAPVLPRAWIAAGAVVAFAASAGARAVVCAWGESTVAELVRNLRP